MISLTSAVLHDDGVQLFAFFEAGERVHVLDDVGALVEPQALRFILLVLGELGVGVDLEDELLLVGLSLDEVGLALSAAADLLQP